LLLSSGVAINFVDRTGDTALHLSTKEGDEKVIEMLPKKDANVDAKTRKDNCRYIWLQKEGMAR
jgi:ankyrin repeat protein